MDIVTQGLLGATLAQAGAKSTEYKQAMLIGFVAPLLADADALIRSSEDPLLVLQFHRHFSHALVFIPIGALIAAKLLWPLFKRSLAFKRIYFYALLGYATAGVLDACTSYGTHLLWPFVDTRIAWNVIAIVDPVFSGVLIGAMLMTWLKNHSFWARCGLVLALCYLGLGAIQHQRALEVVNELALERDHQASDIVVKPTVGNILLWRAVYRADEAFYVDAIRVGFNTNKQVFEGQSVPVFNRERDLPDLDKRSVLYQDLVRFEAFSEGYLVRMPESANAVGDIRYAMLPTSTRPLWFITFDEQHASRHVRFEADRVLTPLQRQTFFNMLFNSEFRNE